MKYIRTKDGIKEYSSDEIIIYATPEQIEYWQKHFKSVIEKSDWKIGYTIEELCDEFVDTSELKVSNTGGWLYDEFDSKNKCLVYYIEDERRTIPLNEFDDLSKIYGAIWTEKGLIYVAKLNEKGEFELL